MGGEHEGVNVEPSLASESATPAVEPPVFSEAQGHLARTLGHAVEEGLGFDVVRHEEVRTRLGPVDAAHVALGATEFAKRLEAREDRDVVFGGGTPEEHAATHRTPLDHAMTTSRVVVGQIVEEQHAVPGSQIGSSPRDRQSTGIEASRRTLETRRQCERVGAPDRHEFSR